VIALTADAQADNRARCLDAGMDDYLTKPMRAETIRDTLARWIKSAPPLRA
jgi:CheY-like chemotaxis protein